MHSLVYVCISCVFCWLIAIKGACLSHHNLCFCGAFVVCGPFLFDHAHQTEVKLRWVPTRWVLVFSWYEAVSTDFKQQLGLPVCFCWEYTYAHTLRTHTNGYRPQSCWLLCEWSVSVWTISLSHTDTECYTRRGPSEEEVLIRLLTWVFWYTLHSLDCMMSKRSQF